MADYEWITKQGERRLTRRKTLRPDEELDYDMMSYDERVALGQEETSVAYYHPINFDTIMGDKDDRERREIRDRFEPPYP